MEADTHCVHGLEIIGSRQLDMNLKAHFKEKITSHFVESYALENWKLWTNVVLVSKVLELVSKA